MKYFFLIIAIIPAIICDRRSDHIANAREWGKVCKAESGVEQEVLNAARTGDFSDDAKYKDYLFCYLKKMELMNENGVILTDNFRELIQSFPPARVEQIMKECAKEGKSPPETAFQIFVCYQRISPEDHAPGAAGSSSSSKS